MNDEIHLPGASRAARARFHDQVEALGESYPYVGLTDGDYAAGADTECAACGEVYEAQEDLAPSLAGWRNGLCAACVRVRSRARRPRAKAGAS